MSAVDFSRPLATLLRESTRKAHETVENSPGATAMLGGKLSVDEYIRYLMMLWHIYE
jgi:heme oxygenase